MQTFSFDPPINLAEEPKWLLAVSSFECTNSVFENTNQNNSFSITRPGHWETKSVEKTVDELNKLLQLRSLELHVKKVRTRGNKIKIGDNECKLSDFDTQKNEKLKKLKNAKYNDAEDLVFKIQLIYDETVDILDLNYIPTKRTGYSLNIGIFEVVDLNNSLKYILLNNVKVSVTIDVVRLKSNLKINQTLLFTEESFLYKFRFCSITFISFS